MSNYPINGHCDERFLPVREAFIQNFEDGLELGASFALSLGGELVVDLWGGSASLDGKRPWQVDTLVLVSSSSKVPVALVGLMLISRELIDPDAPVARYWPEFAAGSKEDLPVRYLFSHTSGLSGFEGDWGLDEMANWDAAVAQLASQEPWWEPGTRSGYHGMTFGFLLGELCKRVTGLGISDFFHQEIARKIGAAFHLGLPSQHLHRRAEIEVNDMREMPADRYSIPGKTYQTLPELVERRNEDAVAQINIPGGMGFGDARALAQIGAILAGGGMVNGQRFLSEEAAAMAWEEQIYSRDINMGTPVRFGMGFGLNSKEIPYPWEHAFHWGGFGGSVIVMVPEVKASWAYTPNKFDVGQEDDDRATRLGAAARKCLLAL